MLCQVCTIDTVYELKLSISEFHSAARALWYCSTLERSKIQGSLDQKTVGKVRTHVIATDKCI